MHNKQIYEIECNSDTKKVINEYILKNVKPLIQKKYLEDIQLKDIFNIMYMCLDNEENRPNFTKIIYLLEKLN